MSKTAFRLLTIILGIILSFSIWFGSILAPILFRRIYQDSYEMAYPHISVLTRFIMDQYGFFILIISLFVGVGLTLSFRRVHESVLGAIGIALPLLVTWFAMFSLFFEAFKGGFCLHHGPEFELSTFLFSFGGFFPITLVLILCLLRQFILEGFRRPKVPEINLPSHSEDPPNSPE